MGWIQIILMIIKYGPAVYNLIKFIINLINEISDYHSKRGELTTAYRFKRDEKRELKMAIEYYERNRDVSRLEHKKEALLKTRMGLMGQ